MKSKSEKPGDLSKSVEQRAKERVENRLGLGVHFVTYVVTNSLLSGINYYQTQDLSWSIYPAFFWGVGLFAHTLVVLFDDHVTRLKEGMVKKEVERMKQEK